MDNVLKQILCSMISKEWPYRKVLKGRSQLYERADLDTSFPTLAFPGHVHRKKKPIYLKEQMILILILADLQQIGLWDEWGLRENVTLIPSPLYCVILEWKLASICDTSKLCQNEAGISELFCPSAWRLSAVSRHNRPLVNKSDFCEYEFRTKPAWMLVVSRI